MADSSRRPQRPNLILSNRDAFTPVPPSLRRFNRFPGVNNTVDAATQALASSSLGPTTPPAPPRRLTSLAARRHTATPLSLSDIDPSIVPSTAGGAAAAGLGAGHPSLLQDPPRRPTADYNAFSNLSKIIDLTGSLTFKGKAVIHADGVDFSSGASFNINMTQLSLLEELGRGNYGTVKKALHKPTKVLMAMKEIRLLLEEAQLKAIIMELEILHRAHSPEIIDFYGAFFVESCVYYCMEYMDAGSLDKLEGAGVPEDVLGRVTSSMVRGLKFLKDELQIIHRDVKPTNVLVNTKGQIKLCDFGVSGQLDKSIAKTNIGCQSYMAPERIKGESQKNPGTYTTASDVWSLGLSMIELAIGRYPFPPETYANVFSQLTAIVHGDSPELPEDGFSEDARDCVAKCLLKNPNHRPTYQELLDHPFLKADAEREVDMVQWVNDALEYREKKLAMQREVQAAQILATQVPPGATSA